MDTREIESHGEAYIHAAHGVTPYYGDANVVSTPNGVDFPIGGQDVYGAIAPRGFRRQQVFLLRPTFSFLY